MKRWAVATAGLMLLAGCAGVEEHEIAQLRVGRTTAAEAIKALGEPDRDEVLSDGSRMLTYVGSKARGKLANFLPGGVYAWGGWTVTNNEAGLMFGPDGALRFYSWSSKDQIPIRLVGRDSAPPVLSEPEAAPGNQNPPPVSGKGASDRPAD
ncbi:hypothetical protein [Magnetospirillum sp. SS-4]|uniref:hypothetical protein n=1 Tax=Magnetospirillum sp. SS-4 TaxID=2681465 RepID=UPI00138161CB|nr:hypothetical protein [Magnetospirillum sp. SS-4]CAA7627573.1 conserved exported hypothetical protein [Magnetospirillum sp. SS-4]